MHNMDKVTTNKPIMNWNVTVERGGREVLSIAVASIPASGLTEWERQIIRELATNIIEHLGPVEG